MRRHTIAVAALVLALAGCGGGSTPADDLASDDGGSQPVSAYKAALNDLAAKCTQDQKQLVPMVEKSRELLAGRHITETDLSIAQHAAKSVPAGSPRMDCAQILGAYVTLREGG